MTVRRVPCGRRQPGEPGVHGVSPRDDRQPGARQPIVDGILTTFEVTDAATDAGSVPASTVSSGVVTTDFVTLTDDSGTISVDVPSSWTDVDTAPLGGEFPQIEATPYRQAYYDTFDVPGVTYRAIHFTTDTESLVHNFAVPDGCAHEAVQPYDDGVFVGSHLIDSECGSFGTAEYHVIVANPANQAFTAVVVVQITGPHELPILERILDSFNVAAGAGPTTSTLPTSSTVAAPTTTTDAAGVFPPPTGEVPAGWTDLIDDTATIRISVPSTWTATRLVSPSDADSSVDLGDDRRGAVLPTRRHGRHLRCSWRPVPGLSVRP